MEISKLDKNAISLLKLIEDEGYKAFIVGGALRNIVLNII